MRNKQLAALALAGTLGLSMVPAVSAAENPDGVFYTEPTAQNPEGGDAASSTVANNETPELVETPVSQEPVVTQEPIVTQEPADGNEGTENSDGSGEIAQDPTVDVAETPVPQEPAGEVIHPDAAVTNMGVTPTPEVEEDGQETNANGAVSAAALEDILKALSSAEASAEKSVRIELTADTIELSGAIVIPSGVTAEITSTAAGGTTFKRSADFADSFFKVNGTLTLGKAGAAKITLDGTSMAASPASMVTVEEGGTLAAVNTAFCNNRTSGNGGAVNNGGTLTLKDVSFVGNAAANGGAIYTTKAVSVSGLVTASDNKKSDNDTQTSNICLAGDAYISLEETLAEGSSLYLFKENVSAGVVLVEKGENVELDSNFNYFTYENGENWSLTKSSDGKIVLAVKLRYVEGTLKRESKENAVATLQAPGCNGWTIYTAVTERGKYTGDNEYPTDEEYQAAGTVALDAEDKFQVSFTDIVADSVDCYVYLSDGNGHISDPIIRLQPRDAISVSCAERTNLAEAKFSVVLTLPQDADTTSYAWYYAWVKKGEAQPELASFKEGGAVNSTAVDASTGLLQAVVKDITESSVDCYFFIGRKEEGGVKPVSMVAAVTDIPDSTVIPSVTPSVTPDATPSVTPDATPSVTPAEVKKPTLYSTMGVKRTRFDEIQLTLDTNDAVGGEVYFVAVKKGSYGSGSGPSKVYKKIAEITEKNIQKLSNGRERIVVTATGITEPSVDCYVFIWKKGNDDNYVRSALMRTPSAADWPMLTASALSRPSLDKAVFTLNTEYADGGTYYYAWVDRNAEKPTEFVMGTGTIANGTAEVTVDGITSGSVDCYFYVEVTDKQGTRTSEIVKVPSVTPYVPSVSADNIGNLNGSYYPGSKIPLLVSPAGLDRTSYHVGDISYVPTGWSISTQAGVSKGSGSLVYDSSTGKYFRNINCPSSIATGNYIMYVTMAEQKWDGQQWVATGSTTKISKAFVISEKPGGTGGEHAPGTTYTGEDGVQYEVLDDGTVVTKSPYSSSRNDGDTTTKDAAATADDTPVAPMVSLMFASLLAGGYIVSRRRKKTEE